MFALPANSSMLGNVQYARIALLVAQFRRRTSHMRRYYKLGAELICNYCIRHWVAIVSAVTHVRFKLVLDLGQKIQYGRGIALIRVFSFHANLL